MTLTCQRCGKRLSRKTARVIDGKPLCSTCMFAPPQATAHERLRAMVEERWPETAPDFCDSGSDPQGENPERSGGVEGEASQSGAEGNRPAPIGTTRDQ